MRIASRAFATVALLASLLMPAAEAQSTASPPGAVRGVFGASGPPSPARTTQQVSTWLDLGGGYDQSVSAADSPGAGDGDGYAVTALGGFRYWRGRSTRSFEAGARLFRNDQNSGRTTATGGEVNLNTTLEFGRRTGIALALRAANEAAVLFGAFGPEFVDPPPADVAIDAPDVSPQQGDLRARWFSLGANATAFRGWSARHRTAVQYAQVRRRPTDDEGVDSDQRIVNVHHDWMVRMNAGILANYRFEQVRQTFPQATLSEPIRTQSAEAGLRFERRLSPIRRASLSFQAGATQVLSSDTPLVGIEGAIEPTGSLNASYTLTRRWLLLAGATRSITVLQGVSQVPFTNALGSLSVTGVVARRVTVAVSGSFSQGSAVGPAPGDFDAVWGTASIRYGFRYGGLFAGYTRYEHRLRQVSLAPGSIAPRFDQSSVRMGLTLWLPLYGAF